MKKYLLVLLGLGFMQLSIAQEAQEQKKAPPVFKMVRAEENYSYLKDKENNPFEKDIFDAIKYIPLSKKGDMYLTLGGQIRPRFEHYSNRFWLVDGDQNFYSQRLALHSNLVLGKNLRFFGEAYHGYVSHQQEFAEYDIFNIFQVFGELKIPFKKGQRLSIRLGRQEMGLGSARLIGIREGPNIRRSYDMARFIFTKDKTKIQAFYGKEVIPRFEAFDNTFALFDETAVNPLLFGVYSQFPINGLNGINELYYLGFQAANSTFNDVTGDEIRHSVGLRRFGQIGKHWQYNTEVIYQFGKIGTDDIRAFSIDTDWHFDLPETKWKWRPGLKLEYTSGDQNTGDGRVNSFNPMFVNPAFYSLAATITPVNIIGIHPSTSFKPVDNLRFYAEWAVFWRASKNDALYRPTRFINRPADGIEDLGIGHQLGGRIEYQINRHTALEFNTSYFIAGNFLEASGDDENILHIAPTLNFRF